MVTSKNGTVRKDRFTETDEPKFYKNGKPVDIEKIRSKSAKKNASKKK